MQRPMTLFPRITAQLAATARTCSDRLGVALYQSYELCRRLGASEGGNEQSGTA